MFDLQYIFLGVIQGLTEFLPISSSAHLILISNFFNWEDQGYLNDVAVHLGTLGAVIFYLKDKIKEIFKDFFKFKSGQTYFFKILLATLPALIIGFIVYNFFSFFMRQIIVIAYANIFFAIVLYFADRFSFSNQYWEKMTWSNFFFIGLCQSLAFIPGASRAGVTITGARILGLKRQSAAVFSMLLSIPIILASTCLVLIDIYGLNSIEINFSKTFLAMLFSFITALLSINFMMKIIEKNSFNLFILYRIILGFVLLIVVYS